MEIDHGRIAEMIDVLLNGTGEETRMPFVLVLCEEEAQRPGATLVRATVMSNMPQKVAQDILQKAVAAEDKRFHQ